jgi:hypothetical protein
MSARLTRLLTAEEHEALEKASIAAGFYRSNPAYLTPGMGWYQRYYFDPANPEAVDENKRKGRSLLQHGNPFLSVHYWRDWAHNRPPLCIVAPNGKLWEIDRPSSNGDGWKVEGTWPNLTCAPSIVLPGYHGFLRNGQFTSDLDGRGDVGIPYVQAPRPTT